MIYWNGKLHPTADVSVSPHDRGLLLGDGVFETLRARAGRIEYCEAHLARLARGAALLGIPLPPGLADALEHTLAANTLQAESAVLRLTLTRGPGGRGLEPPVAFTPTVLISAAPYPDQPLPPATAHIAELRRNERSPLSAIKSLNALDNQLARQAARARGRDEALLLNTRDRLAGASAGNLFIVLGDQIITPPLAEGALPGVIRAVLLAQGAETGLSFVERPISPSDLQQAGEAFLTNSLIGIRPLVAWDEEQIGTGQPGPFTGRLQTWLRPRG